MFRKNYQKKQPSKTPNILFKYKYFDSEDNHLDILRKNKLWFSSAQSFNDPFDSNLFYTFDDVSYIIKYKWAESVLKLEEPNLTKRQRDEFIKNRLYEMKQTGEISRLREEQLTKNYKKFGVCCLTSCNNDLLMWAHYTDKHEGFVVGIDTKKILQIQNSLAKINKLLLLHRVEYSSRIPNINFYKSMLSNKWDDDTIKLLITKSIHWKYEKEFRLINWGEIKVDIDLGSDAIKEIYLGCRIKDINKRRIMKIIDNYSSPVSVYQAKKDPNKFKLKFEKIV